MLAAISTCRRHELDMHSDEWATSRQLPSAKDDCVAIVSTHECSSSTLFIVNIKCIASHIPPGRLTMKSN